MAKGRVEIPDNVAAVLRASTIDDHQLRLPFQLDRATYTATNKVLEALGGKWNRKAAAHVFTEDPRSLLEAALNNGHAIDARKANGQFFTPLPLVERMVNLAGITAGLWVLEPSAGDGRIARACRDLGAHILTCELDPRLAAGLRADGFECVEGDFLAVDLEGVRPPFDAVVMNPPFSAGADVKHIRQAYRLLTEGGVLVAVASAAVTFRETRIYREFVEDFGPCWEPLPADTFQAEGTGVNTVLVTLTR